MRARWRRSALRGFTLLELLLAMTIGAVLVAAGFGLILSTERMNESFATRLEQSNKMAFVQRTIARSLQSLVTAPEGYEPLEAAQTAAETRERIERFAGLRGQDLEDAREAIRRQARETPVGAEPGDEEAEEQEDRALPSRRERDVPPAPPRFRIGHLGSDGEWEDRGDEAGEGVRRVEMLLASPPIGRREIGPPARGALDLVPTPTATEPRWRLQWTPIRPSGKPTILLEDLILAEWSVTDSRGQFDQFEAYEKTELPWALRVILWTEDGLKVDWMFDLGASATTGDPL